MISFKQTGDFANVTKYLSTVNKSSVSAILDRYGKEGLLALISATPVDSGLTASSWSYAITNSNGVAAITFYNSNIQNGVNVAVILQYGHATRNGSWIEGLDYINPSIQPIFEHIAEDAWKEVNR